MRKLFLGLAASTALLAAGAANASITAQVWVDHQTQAENATIAGIEALGAADATVLLPFLDFSTGNSTVTTIDQFLGSSIGGAVGGHALNNSVFIFTGSAFLNAGNNAFVVPHDDGLQLSFDGGIGLVVDEPGPTGEVDTPFNVIAPHDGLFQFTMSYGECCGGPAVIRFDINGAPVGGGVPEPATWAMMMVGFGGLGAMMRRRRSVALAA